LDEADREARIPDSFRRDSADRVTRMEQEEATRAAQRGVGRQGSRELTERDFVNAARDTMGTTKGAEIQGKQQFLQHKADQERREQGRVSHETAQKGAELNLQLMEKRLQESGSDAESIKQVVELRKQIEREDSNFFKNMLDFSKTEAYDTLGDDQKGQLNAAMFDYFQSRIGGREQSPQQTISPQAEQTIRQRFAAAPDDATREAMRKEAKERFGLTL
jgi:predicted GNAT family N-acyltransferase